ncbi:MAG: hypothetical protein KIT12_08680 [Trueperaceae bacterium]|nr:hypothetical protein [Trueperaceae bacterium]
MRRALIAIAALVLVAIGLSQAGIDWGRAAVRDLGEVGVETGFPDGSFLGEACDRLSGRRLVDRLLTGAGRQRHRLHGRRRRVTDPASDSWTLAFDHWAAGAANRIATLGINPAFPDRRLNGDEFLSGYQVALLIDQAVGLWWTRRSLAARLQSAYRAAQLP